MKNSVTDNYPTIESIEQQFQTWRSTRSRRETIPQHLWLSAIALCRVHSISHVSQRLRLSYTDLRKRLNPPQPRIPADSLTPEFTEVKLNSLFQSQDQWQMFCQRPDGSLLKLSGNTEHPPVTDILKGFLS
jgi:hypothetical protein